MLRSEENLKLASLMLKRFKIKEILNQCMNVGQKNIANKKLAKEVLKMFIAEFPKANMSPYIGFYSEEEIAIAMSQSENKGFIF